MISSTVGIKPGSLLPDCPFLKIVIALPVSAFLDQLFLYLPLVKAVLPNLILLPNLPSNILSPANEIKGLILAFSTKLAPLSPLKSNVATSSVFLWTLPIKILNADLFLLLPASVLGASNSDGIPLLLGWFQRLTAFR